MRYAIIIFTGLTAAAPLQAQSARAAAMAHRALEAQALTAQTRAFSVHATSIAAHARLAVADAFSALTAADWEHGVAHASALSASTIPVHARGAFSTTSIEAQTLPRASWAPQDPADSLWRSARAALNDNDDARAAALYAQIRTNSRYARSAYRAPSYYWEAYARERIGTAAELQNARRVLEQLKRDHPGYDGMAEANRLEAGINGRLAQLGDRRAVGATSATAAQAATQQCDETQMAALDALMHMPHESSMPILKRVMQRRDCDKMREKAVFLIAQSRSPDAQQILLDAVRNDPNRKVKEQAVFFLSQVPSEQAVDALESIIRSGTDEKLMETAVFALSQHRSPRATELLRQLVARNDLPADVRANAVFSLGQRADANAGPLLRNLYAQTTDPKVKEMILFSLSQRRDAANGEFLFQIAMNEREDIEVRKNALFFAGQQGSVQVSRLAELYRNMTNMQMREQVLFALSQSRDPEAVTQLIEILRIERNTELRKNIIFWLGQSRDPRAVRAIAEIIGG